MPQSQFLQPFHYITSFRYDYGTVNELETLNKNSSFLKEKSMNGNHPGKLMLRPSNVFLAEPKKRKRQFQGTMSLLEDRTSLPYSTSVVHSFLQHTWGV